MPLLIVAACIACLLLLISRFRVNPFLSFLIVSAGGGLALGISPAKVGAALQTGIGDTLGSVAVVIVCGAMLGKLVAVSGAAQRITTGLMQLFGERFLQSALVLTGLVVGIPLFYTVGFVVLFPLMAAIIYRYRVPPLMVGLPVCAALSCTHGFLPPHPSPTALIAQFHADMGTTLLYGLIIAVPAVVIAGPLFSRTARHINATLLKSFAPVETASPQLPGLANSLLSTLLPVLLMAGTALAGRSPNVTVQARSVLAFLSDPSILMLLSLCIATFSLGLLQGMKLPALMDLYTDAVKDVVMIMLIVAGAGAFKEVLVQSGVDKLVGRMLDGLHVNPLILGWTIAAVIRVCVGSATVAGLTAAGIVAPLLIAHPQVNPSLMVLAVGAGSLMFSHVNDAGFWLFKEYFGLSIKDTLRSWSLTETLVAVCGLAGVLTLSAMV